MYTRLSGEKSTIKCLSHTTAKATDARQIRGTTMVTVFYTNRLSHGKSLAIMCYANGQSHCTTLVTLMYTRRLSHGTHMAAELYSNSLSYG